MIENTSITIWLEGGGSMVSYEVIGKHIHDARVRLGMTQAEVAYRAGMGAAYFGKIERGAIRPNLDRLADISQALRIPFESLFQGAFIPEAVLLDNTPLPSEECEVFLSQICQKADNRTRQIMMRVCGELSNMSMPKEE